MSARPVIDGALADHPHLHLQLRLQRHGRRILVLLVSPRAQYKYPDALLFPPTAPRADSPPTSKI